MASGYTTAADGTVIPTLTRGSITGIGKSRNSHALLQSSAVIVPGDSGGAVVNGRGKLIGVATASATIEGVHNYYAIGSDTVYAFLALPPDKGVPPPPVALYRGDPRGVVLTAGFLGTGWVQDEDRTSKISEGTYYAEWHNSAAPVVVGAGVMVLPSVQAAEAGLEYLAPESGDVQIQAPTVGDDATAWLTADHTGATVVARVKNVVLVATEVRAVPLSPDEVYGSNGIGGMLAFMAQRVTSQAH
jgi:S1-C subfamily serine protease